MIELTKDIKRMIEAGDITIFIGYTNGLHNNIRPLFATKGNDLDKLVCDDNCVQNLAVYLNKPEIKSKGKIGILAKPHALRSIVQLTAENQINDNSVAVFTLDKESRLIDFTSISDIEKYLADIESRGLEKEWGRIRDIEEMSREERWKFWTDALNDCIKCYACRAACPLCYCNKCIVENNQPQWIPSASHNMGNLEWQINRVMHLAGRCVNCGECVRACPMDIPINIMTIKLNKDIQDEFGYESGKKANELYALSTYRAEDKEIFIR
jgi:ferredoxin